MISLFPKKRIEVFKGFEGKVMNFIQRIGESNIFSDKYLFSKPQNLLQLLVSLLFSLNNNFFKWNKSEIAPRKILT